MRWVQELASAPGAAAISGPVASYVPRLRHHVVSVLTPQQAGIQRVALFRNFSSPSPPRGPLAGSGSAELLPGSGVAFESTPRPFVVIVGGGVGNFRPVCKLFPRPRVRRASRAAGFVLPGEGCVACFHREGCPGLSAADLRADIANLPASVFAPALGPAITPSSSPTCDPIRKRRPLEGGCKTPLPEIRCCCPPGSGSVLGARLGSRRALRRGTAICR